MNHKEYWKRREDEALKHYIKDEKEYDKRINQIYSNMLDNCNREINAFYGKYADKEGITLAEAKKRVSKADIAALERKAARYVKDASLDRKANGGKTDKSGYYFSPKAEEEMRLYNATMKINRLEMLKANIGLEMIKGHDELDKFMGEILQGRTEEELKRQAGILGKTITNNAQTAHAIVNASFHNATFSDRVWMYHDIMKADLDKMLQTGLIQGKNPRVLARELEKYVLGDAKGGARFNAERLMRTELARVQTEAQKQSFERNGFEQYTFLANSGCCDLCKDKDGKHFKVKDMMPGENAAPLHPHCRCSVAAYEDSKEYEEWLDHLANGGTTAEFEALKAKGGKVTTPATKTQNKAKNEQKQGDTALTKEQEKALEWYVSGEGQFINQYLRGNVGSDFGELSQTEKHYLEEMTNATNRVLPKNINKLYRSVDATAIFGNMSVTDFYNLESAILYNNSDKFALAAKQKYLTDIKGKTITEKGFLSTSKDYEVIVDWGDYTGAEKPINIEFEVPDNAKGVDLARFDVEGDEQKEILLARNTSYEIVDVLAKDGRIYIKAKIK